MFIIYIDGADGKEIRGEPQEPPVPGVLDEVRIDYCPVP